MPYYRRVGNVPPKRHTQHRSPSGSLYHEELVGEEGFSSSSALLYHRHDPSALVDVRPWSLPDQTLAANDPLKPRHLRLHDLFTAEDAARSDVVTGRRLVLANADVRISYVAAGRASPLHRNATGDECVYLEAGAGTLESAFGALKVHAGDYVLIPRFATHRWVPDGDGPIYAYCIEANSHLGPPSRYMARSGQFLEHSPYCERDLRGPSPTDPIGGTDVEVYVKHRGSGPSGVAGSIHVQPSHPFDVVGWDGCLYPYAFNVADFEPITGRIHQPPPTHQVFEAAGLVVCNFVPRKVDYHPDAIPVPYHHANVDSDEVMFYVAGDYEARRGSGIKAGSVSLHPAGHTHGPQPGAAEASIGAERFEELAIMIDTFAPLALGEAALACEDPGYAWTWSGRGPGG